MTIEDFKKLIAPLHRRVMHMFAKGVIEKVDDNAEDQQECQVSMLEDEVADDTERMQNYGFVSNPKPGADAFIALMGGNRDHGVIIAVDDRRYRLKGLQSGEVAVYTDEGDKIVLKRGRKIEITTLEVNIVAPLVKMSGNLQVTGGITSATATIGGLPFATHRHTEQGDGNPVSTPIP